MLLRINFEIGLIELPFGYSPHAEALLFPGPTAKPGCLPGCARDSGVPSLTGLPRRLLSLLEGPLPCCRSQALSAANKHKLNTSSSIFPPSFTPTE